MHRQGADDFYAKSEELFSVLDKSEVETWCKHPVAKALILSLQGDMIGHFESWMHGEFTGSNADETIQKNSKALGSAEAIESILEWLEDAEKGVLYD